MSGRYDALMPHLIVAPVVVPPWAYAGMVANAAAMITRAILRMVFLSYKTPPVGG